MLLEDDADDHFLKPPEAAADPDAVAFADSSIGLGVIAVDVYLAPFTRALGFRTCLEQAGDIEPDVQPNAVGHDSDEDFHSSLRSKRFHECDGLALFIALLQVLLDLRAHLVQRHGALGLLLGNADDVISELRFDQAARGARLEAERRVVERTNQLTLLKESEVASILRATVLRVLLGERGEILP